MEAGVGWSVLWATATTEEEGPVDNALVATEREAMDAPETAGRLSASRVPRKKVGERGKIEFFPLIFLGINSSLWHDPEYEKAIVLPCALVLSTAKESAGREQASPEMPWGVGRVFCGEARSEVSTVCGPEDWRGWEISAPLFLGVSGRTTAATDVTEATEVGEPDGKGISWERALPVETVRVRSSPEPSLILRSAEDA